MCIIMYPTLTTHEMYNWNRDIKPENLLFTSTGVLKVAGSKVSCSHYKWVCFSASFILINLLGDLIRN